MTTDSIEIKDDIAEDEKAADLDNQRNGDRQPPQAQQRTEDQPDVPAKATDDDVGLAPGNKGKSPGNGG